MMTPQMWTSRKMRKNISRKTTKNTTIPMNTIIIIWSCHKMKTIMIHKNMTCIQLNNHGELKTTCIDIQDNLSIQSTGCKSYTNKDNKKI